MLDIKNLLTPNRFTTPSPIAGAAPLEYRLTADQLESAFEQLETSVCKECSFIAPTISPPDTSDATHSMGYLEHPRDVFAYYRAKRVDFLFAQEKLMGSRATILAVRDEPEKSQIWSRSGRPFFDRQTTTEIMKDVLADLRYMMPHNYATCLLDTEAMPWSLKSGKLGNKVFRRSALSAKNYYDRLAYRLGTQAKFVAAPDGDVKPCLFDPQDINQREHNASQMLQLIDWYLPDNQSALKDAQFNVFDILAISLEGEGAPADHYEVQQPAFSVQFIINQMSMHKMRRLVPVKTHLVDLNDEESCEYVTDKWLAYTGCGGEGFVFKTREYRTDPATKQFIIPAMKCRGREYMRLTYGVNYTEPESFKLFKGRSTARKRMLSAVEYQLALGGLLARQRLSDIQFEEWSSGNERELESLEDTMYLSKLHVLACEQDKKIDIRL